MLRLSLLESYPDLKLGYIEVDIYSAHIYAQHYDLVRKMISSKPESHWMEIESKIPVNCGYAINWYKEQLCKYVHLHYIEGGCECKEE
jgi:thymidylate synthase